MLLGTGARIGEILALRWEDLDLDARPSTVLIGGTLIRIESELVVQGRPKTAGSHRVLVVPEFTRAVLVARRMRLAPVEPRILSSRRRRERRRIRTTSVASGGRSGQTPA